MSSKKHIPILAKEKHQNRDGGQAASENRLDQGSNQWIRDALAAHEAALLRYCRHLVHDAECARDIVQETFVKLIRQVRSGKDRLEQDHSDQDNLCTEPRLKNWLFKVCRNNAIDHLRKVGKMQTHSMQTHSVSDQEFDKVEIAGNEKTPDAQTECSDSFAHLMEFIDRLPGNQQEVLRLKFQNSMSYKQIAEVSGLTVSHVGVLLHTALGTLRKKLKVEVK